MSVPDLRTACLLSLALLVGCGQSPSDRARELARRDPLFGAAESLLERVGSPSSQLDVDTIDASRLASERSRLDREAIELVERAGMSDATVTSVLGFLDTPDGAALVEAEQAVLLALTSNASTVFEDVWGALREPERVGEVARVELRRAAVGIGRNEPFSPFDLTVLLAASLVRPEQATAIDTFLTSQPGSDWMAARKANLETEHERYKAFLEHLVETGVARWGDAEFEDLILPEADFAVPTEESSPASGESR